jgi:hypothetical protein
MLLEWTVRYCEKTGRNAIDKLKIRNAVTKVKWRGRKEKGGGRNNIRSRMANWDDTTNR